MSEHVIENTKRLDHIDAAKAIAILMIMLGHITELANPVDMWIVGLTKVAALELAPRNIRVNCICPNTMDTPMAYAEGCETELNCMKIQTPLARMCDPKEAAALYHFLASDDCRYITGEDIYIDGGKKAGPAEQLLDSILKSLEV